VAFIRFRGALVFASTLAVSTALTACAADEPGRSTITSPTTSVAGPDTPVTASNPPTTQPPEPVAIGDPVDVAGLEVTVVEADVVDEVNNGLAQGRFLRVEVALQAVSGTEHAYAPTDFTLALPDGRTVEPFAYSSDDRLGFGTVTGQASADGAMAWRLSDESGPAVVRYEAPGRSASAAWRLDLGG
jgi:hypothetical protein